MQYPSSPFHSPATSEPASSGPDPSPRSPDQLDAADAVRLLQLMAGVSSLRNDPKAWRTELLAGLNKLLGTTIAASLLIKNFNLAPRSAGERKSHTPRAPAEERDGTAAGNPIIACIVETGFKNAAQRQAFLHECNAIPFADPLFRGIRDRLLASDRETVTALRAELVDDATWQHSPRLIACRRATGVGDCAISLQNSAEPGTLYVLCAFLPAAPEHARAQPAQPPPPAAAPPRRLGPREKLVLDTLHRGLLAIYKAEESSHRLSRATGLPPRLRQTLSLLLAGDTERQVALKMSLSVHTVHDYVKTLYTHFGVSSRSSLLAKWMQTAGHLPPGKDQ